MSQPRYRLLRVMPARDNALAASANHGKAVLDAGLALAGGDYGTGEFVLAALHYDDDRQPVVMTVIAEFTVDVQHVVRKKD